METQSISDRSGARPPAKTPDRADIRAQLHDMWTAVAPHWEEHAAYVDARGAEIAEAMLALSLPQPGERVLELACGPAGLGLAAAARVAPDGEVVVSDVVAEMTAIAAASAAALGLGNVTTRVLDLEEIDEPDASFDVVLCREGLMFASDPERAAREIERVLRPGGRIAVAVWGPRELNPWLGIVFDAVTAHTGMPVPPPGIPGPFSLADAEELARLFTGGALVGVTVGSVAVPTRAASFDEWWERTCALAGPLARRLASLPAEVSSAIRAEARDATDAYVTETGVELPGVALLVSGRHA